VKFPHATRQVKRLQRAADSDDVPRPNRHDACGCLAMTARLLNRLGALIHPATLGGTLAYAFQTCRIAFSHGQVRRVSRHCEILVASVAPSGYDID
jgi:hypothetical protein